MPPPPLQEARRRARARPALARMVETSRCASHTSQLSASLSCARRLAARPPSFPTSSPMTPDKARLTPPTTTAGPRERQPSECSSFPPTCSADRTAGRNGWQVCTSRRRSRRRRRPWREVAAWCLLSSRRLGLSVRRCGRGREPT